LGSTRIGFHTHTKKTPYFSESATCSDWSAGLVCCDWSSASSVFGKTQDYNGGVSGSSETLFTDIENNLLWNDCFADRFQSKV